MDMKIELKIDKLESLKLYAKLLDKDGTSRLQLWRDA